jgi:hypothetical protein
MKNLVTRLSRAAMMGLAVAAAWVPVGVIAGPLFVGELEPEHIGGPLYSGFVCGAVFYVLAGIASGRRLGDLPASQAAAWGAASGLFTGVLPFVLGEGHYTDYQAAWSSTAVATTALVAAIAASRRWLGPLSPARAAILAAIPSGLIAGVLPWILTSQDVPERFLPVVVAGGLSGLGALTGLLMPAAARWLQKQNASSPTSVKADG